MDWAVALWMPIAALLLVGLLFVLWRRARRTKPGSTLSSESAATHATMPEPQPRPPVPPPAAADLDDLTLEDATSASETQMAEPEPAKAADSPVPQPARFSAYYPKEAAPDVWLPLRAYVFRLNAAGEVAKDAADALNEAITDYRPVSGDSSAPLAEGALITATPDLPGFQFNPPSVSVAFYEDWQVLPFRLRAAAAPLEQAANGRITFTADGVIIADLPLSIFVTGNPDSSAAPVTSADADPYDSIFCSYSHRDTAIVERVERAYQALGLDTLRDVTTLRSGEHWNTRLLELIAGADIFQLFWSTSAAESKYVRQEWEYALSLQRGGAFIRPVYWEQPMPKAPAELSALHFHFDPALDD